MQGHGCLRCSLLSLILESASCPRESCGHQGRCSLPKLPLQIPAHHPHWIAPCSRPASRLSISFSGCPHPPHTSSRALPGNSQLSSASVLSLRGLLCGLCPCTARTPGTPAGRCARCIQQQTLVPSLTYICKLCMPPGADPPPKCLPSCTPDPSLRQRRSSPPFSHW